MSSNRIIVDAAICDESAERFTDHASKLKYGDPKNSHTVIGPIINRNQLQNMMDLIEKSVGAGARKLIGGDPEGLVLPPHVFGDVTNHMPLRNVRRLVLSRQLSKCMETVRHSPWQTIYPSACRVQCSRAMRPVACDLPRKRRPA